MKWTEAPDCYPFESVGKPSGKVANCFLDVEEKGYNTIKDNFNAKLYESFPDSRFELLM